MSFEDEVIPVSPHAVKKPADGSRWIIASLSDMGREFAEKEVVVKAVYESAGTWIVALTRPGNELFENDLHQNTFELGFFWEHATPR